MDLWVIAAAAGAGCIAKNLQNFSADKKESPRGPSLKYSSNVQTESRNFLQQLRDKTCPLRRLAQARIQDDGFLDLEHHSEATPAASVSGDYSQKTSVLEDYDFSTGGVGVVRENHQFVDGESMSLSKINGGKMGRIRRCHKHSIRQLASLENAEHSSYLHPSLSQSRPVLATDASNSCFNQFDSCLNETIKDSKTSSCSLEQFESVENVKKSNEGFCSQGGESMLLFITGMTIGILSATNSGKNEVDKLNIQLNQMQSLVQDLHEELDMKEMVVVKEMDDEEGDAPLSIEEPCSSPSLVKASDKKAENLELLSRIEAELQAELEMLENNMKVSDQDRISSFVELDSDSEPEIVRGELKASMVEEASESSETTATVSGFSKPANYAVPPWELSLKLHELIESRLETRIKELETALLHSQNSRVGLQQRSIVSERRYSYSETESSSTNHYNPSCICGEEHENMPQIWGNEDSTSEDDESELLLIKQIIERRKSGSGFNFRFD